MMLPILAAAFIFGSKDPATDPVLAFRRAYRSYLDAQTVGEQSAAYTEMTTIASAVRDMGASSVQWRDTVAKMDRLLAGVQAPYRKVLAGRDAYGRSTVGLPVGADLGYGVMNHSIAAGRSTVAAAVAPGLGAWTPPDADPRRPGRQRPHGVGPRHPRDTRPNVPGVQPPRGHRPPDARPNVPGYQRPHPGRNRGPVDTMPNVPGIQGPEFCRRHPGHPACIARRRRPVDAAPNIPGIQPPGIPPIFPFPLPPGVMPKGILPPGVPDPAAFLVEKVEEAIGNGKAGSIEGLSGYRVL